MTCVRPTYTFHCNCAANARGSVMVVIVSSQKTAFPVERARARRTA